jgi:hypothetical protein
MRWMLWFSCAALLCSVSVREARAEWPRINPKLKSKQVTIHKAVVLPAQVSYKKLALFKGVVGGTDESDQIASTLYSVVTMELAARGVEVLSNPMDSAKTDAERYAIADLQVRYDSVGAQMRKKPGWVEHGRITLDDRVARFAPGVGSDAIVFVRGDGANRVPMGSLRMTPFRAEVTFVDAKTGDVLAFVRFGISRDVAKKTEERLMHGLREAMQDVPLPAPPPKN